MDLFLLGSPQNEPNENVVCLKEERDIIESK